MTDIIGNQVIVGNWVTYITGGGKSPAWLRIGRVTIIDEKGIQIQPYKRENGCIIPDVDSNKARKCWRDVTLIKDLG